MCGCAFTDGESSGQSQSLFPCWYVFPLSTGVWGASNLAYFLLVKKLSIKPQKKDKYKKPTYGAHYCHWDIWDEVLYELCRVILMLICSLCKRSGANQPITDWHDCQHQQNMYCSFHQTSAVTDDNISFWKNDCWGFIKDVKCKAFCTCSRCVESE